MGNVCNNMYSKKSVGISYNEMNISSVIDHMSDIYKWRKLLFNYISENGYFDDNKPTRLLLIPP